MENTKTKREEELEAALNEAIEAIKAYEKALNESSYRTSSPNPIIARLRRVYLGLD